MPVCESKNYIQVLNTVTCHFDFTNDCDADFSLPELGDIPVTLAVYTKDGNDMIMLAEKGSFSHFS